MRIISDYKQLMIGKYQDIQAIAKDETLEEIDRQIKILAILADMPEDEILHLPLPDYEDMVHQMAFLSSPDINTHKVAKVYNIGGFNLVPCLDYRKLETGQYIDFQTYAATFEEHFPEFLSVILVPKDMRYTEGYDILDVQRAIREELCVTDALSVAAFFLTSWQQSIPTLANSLERKAKKMRNQEARQTIMEKIKALRNLRINGVG